MFSCYIRPGRDVHPNKITTQCMKGANADSIGDTPVMVILTRTSTFGGRRPLWMSI